jgi:hypothetical protein
LIIPFQLYPGSNTKIFSYYMIPCSAGTLEPLVRRTGEKSFQIIEYPYTQLGPLKSHLHRHFVIVNVAIKRIEYGPGFYENIRQILQPYYPERITSEVEVIALCLMIQDIYSKWMSNRVDADEHVPPKPHKREKSGGNDSLRAPLVRSQGKRPN